MSTHRAWKVASSRLCSCPGLLCPRALPSHLRKVGSVGSSLPKSIDSPREPKVCDAVRTRHHHDRTRSVREEPRQPTGLGREQKPPGRRTARGSGFLGHSLSLCLSFFTCLITVPSPGALVSITQCQGQLGLNKFELLSFQPLLSLSLSDVSFQSKGSSWFST